MRKRLSLFAWLMVCSVLAMAQTKEITGKVTDPQGVPVSSATIKIKGANGGTSAGIDGTFRINAPANATLVISSIGFETAEVNIGESSTVNVEMKQANNALNEVVVTALGIRREKRMLTYTT